MSVNPFLGQGLCGESLDRRWLHVGNGDNYIEVRVVARHYLIGGASMWVGTRTRHSLHMGTMRAV